MRRGALVTFIVMTLAAWLIVGVATALAYWTSTASSGDAGIHALADALPQGFAPTATTTDGPNGSTVSVLFPRASTTMGGVPITTYDLRRIATSGMASTVVAASCVIEGFAVSCIDTAVPDGRWRYADTPTYGQSWKGIESVPGPQVLVDTSAPVVTVGMPIMGDAYNDVTWDAAGGAMSGRATDATSGIPGAASITLVITQASTGLRWNGVAFDAGSGGVAATSYDEVTGQWTYAFPAASFPADGTYNVVVRASDAVGNAAVSASTTFVIDNDLAVASTFPVAGRAYNAASWAAGAPVAGYALSIASVVTSVVASVQSGGGAESCWTGSASAFTASCPNFLATSGVPSSWSFQLSAAAFPHDGGYSIKVRATDAVGITEVSTTPFVYDTIAPALALSAPAAGSYVSSVTPTLSGAGGTQAGDEDHSADSPLVTVDVHAGSTSAGATVASSTGAVTGGAWSITPAALTPNAQYTVRAVQQDGAGNVAATESTFVIDTSAPSVAISAPADGATVTTSTPTFAGTAGTAVATSTTSPDAAVVAVRIYAGTTMSGTPTQVVSATRTAATWSVTTNALAAGRYVAQAVQLDAAGNVGVGSAVSFTVALGPTVAVTFPVDGTWYSGGGTGWNATHGSCPSRSVCGTTSASYGQVSGVAVQMVDVTTGLCWNGKTNNTAAFNATCTSSSAVAGGYFAATNTGTTYSTWSLTAPIANQLVDGHSYRAVVRASDAAGAQSTVASFGYDTTPPLLGGVHVINIDTGGVDEVMPGHAFFVVATIADSSSGIATATANVSALDGVATDTAVPLASCAGCSVRGITYSHISARYLAGAATGNRNITVAASDRAQAPNSTSSGNVPILVDGTAPTVKTVLLANHVGGIAGHPEPGDTIAITYSSVLSVPSICSTWSLSDAVAGTVSSSATIALTAGSTDTVTMSATGCILHVGSMSLGASGFVVGAAGQAVTFAGSSIAWDGISKLTITLGSQVGGSATVGTVAAATTATYSPDPVITDVAGNRISGTGTTGGRVQF